jgi:PAS domain S-box-containing protein
MAVSERTTVLIVDDEPGLLDVSKAFLERGGCFKVDTSPSAIEAIRVMDLEKYDAIVSDYQMPGMNGIEFLKDLRMQGNDVPFILFTGRSQEEVAILALNAGADFYLKKGTDVKAQYAELSNFIDQAVARHRAVATNEQNLRRFQKLVESTSDIVEVVDYNHVIRFANPAVERLLGKKPEEIVETKLISSPTKQKQLEVVLRSLLDGKLEKAKVIVKAKHVNGSVHLLDATITRLVNGRLGPELIIDAKEISREPTGQEPDLIV